MNGLPAIGVFAENNILSIGVHIVLDNVLQGHFVGWLTG